MSRRVDLAGLALLALAGLLWLVRDAVAWAASAALPSLGFPLLALLVKAIAAMLVVGGAYRLRAPLSALGARLLGRLDAAEVRLEKLPLRRAQALRALTVGLLVGSATAAVFEWAYLGSYLETRALDLFFRLRFPERSQVELATGRELPSARKQDDVVVIALDDETIAHAGWPMPRVYYARLIDAVSAAKPASLTFDISLVDPGRDHPEWDQDIGEAARRAGNVAFTFTVARTTNDARAPVSEIARAAFEANSIPWQDSAEGLPEYAELIGGDAAPQPVIDAVTTNVAAVAMANVLLDGGDDVLRHSLLVARMKKTLFPSLSLRIAAAALEVPLRDIHVFPGSHVDLGGKRQIPIDKLGRTIVRYQGRHDTRGAGPFRYVSLWSLIRADSTLTLSGNPMGEDQRFVLDEQTVIKLDGATVPLAGVDPTLLRAGATLSGKARYSTDPGRILELELVNQRSGPVAGGGVGLAAERGPNQRSGPVAGGGVGLAAERSKTEPEFELIDEQTLRFSTTISKASSNASDVASLTGKHVLVGSTALAAADLRISPLGEMPGVEHHATMLSNLLKSDFFTLSPRWANALLVVLAATLAAFVAVSMSIGGGLLLTSLLLLTLLTGSYVLSANGVYVPIVGPSAAVSLTFFSCLTLAARASRNAATRAEREREFVRQTFGRYLTEQVVQTLLDSPDGLRLGGKRDFVTIMMTDLRGFTSMCGTMEPENVVKLLNHYLEAMTRIITRYGGTIDEFIGDAILVVFGAPLKLEHAETRAVACAIEMLNAMPEINRWNVTQGLPEVEMGIGVHSGEVVLGNIGSELRAKYGIVGATINLTSRVESYTVGGQVLISEATRERCGEALTLGTTQVVSPKGVKGTLTIHEAIAVSAPYEVRLQSATEHLAPPLRPLEVRYGTVKNKQVAELSHLAQVEALSALGMELRVDEELPELSDLQLRLVEGDGLHAGDLYGKVLRANVRPHVVYLRLTSVPPELKSVLEAARAAPALVIADSALVSS